MVRTPSRNTNFVLGLAFITFFSIPTFVHAQLDDPILNEQEVPLNSSEDELFNNTEDLDITEDNINHLDTFTSDEVIKFFASFTVQGGIGIGWSDWIDFTDISTGFVPSAGVTLNSSFGISIRPSKDLYGLISIKASFPGNNTTDTNSYEEYISELDASSLGYSLGLDSLILDYTLADTIFLRFGNALPTWGNARIYNAVDLLSRGPEDSETFLLKADIPIGLHYLSALVISKDWYQTEGSGLSPKNLAYGLRASFNLGPIEWGLGVLHQDKMGPQAFTSLKTAFGGIDYFAEAKIVSTDWSQWFISLVSGFFYEWKNPNIQLGGEYFYNGERLQGIALVDYAPELSGHNVNLKLLWKNFESSGIDWLIDWKHNFTDNTGSVQTGIIVSPLPFFNFAVGVPLYYGILNGEISNFQRLGIFFLARIEAAM